ncbi:MAG: hypothetical protein JW941_02025 [Candidatus Coatesbacteria bacterium]|nr:hypothetical protein [Candidatus Coatesbacteria bacterium]
MFRKLFLINLSLSVAAVLMALWLAEIWQGPLGQEAKADTVTPRRISRDEYAVEKMEAGSGYELMVERDLFRPDRTRYIPPEPSPTKTPTDDADSKEKPNLEVYGIMILSDRIKYAIVAEKAAQKVQPKRPARRSRRSRRTSRSTPTPTPTPDELLDPRSYRVGEEVKDGWYVAEIRHTLVVFSNGQESFEVAVLKTAVPEQDQADEEQEKEKSSPASRSRSTSRRTPPKPPDRDEATQRFLDALKRAGKK